MLLPEAIVGIAAGGQHTLLLAESGSVWATGSNSRGQLGLGKAAPAASLRPHRIPALAGGPRLAALRRSPNTACQGATRVTKAMVVAPGVLSMLM